MIKLIDIALDETYLAQHDDLAEYLNEGYQIIGHCTFAIGIESWERYTLYKAPEKQEKVAAQELELAIIISVQRDETKNNRRPMWRCLLDSGEMVNVFQNDDEPEKDSYHLFKKANWGTFLHACPLFETKQADIQIAMKKNGRWWEVAVVRKNRQNDIPDWAKEPYLFDDIVTEDENQEGDE
jgi:hypothetical protein